MRAFFMPLLAGLFSAAVIASPTIAADADCELHVWPATALESVSEGFWLNQTRDQMLNTQILPHPRLATALTPAGQYEALAALDLPALLGLGKVRTVTHADPPPREPTGSLPIARVETPGICHVELTIRRLIFAKNGLAGGALQGFFTVRRFGTDGALAASFSSTADAPLPHFPGPMPQQEENERARLQAALRSDLIVFAGYYARTAHH